MNDTDWIILIIIVFLVLLTQVWFWAALYVLFIVGCIFSVIACLINFQIIGAIGVFILYVVVANLFRLIADK